MKNDRYSMRDPTSEAAPELRERTPPPASLAGLRIGLFSISKERSSEFLDALEHALHNRGLATARFAKPTHTKPATPTVLQAIAEGCDVVVEGLAD